MKQSLRDCLKIRSGAVFGARAEWQGARKENILHGSSTDEQRRQPALATKTLRAAGLLIFGFVVAGVTARCGDAPPTPPRPKSKSRAAAPLPIFRQSLRRAQSAGWGGCVAADWCPPQTKKRRHHFSVERVIFMV